jgi:4-hydroxybenzoate polyprenyltransferase
VSIRPNPSFGDFAAGFFRLIRMKNLMIVMLTQYLTRIFLIGPKDNWVEIITDYQMFLICFSTLLIAAAGYIINDYFDVKIDLVNKPQRVVIGRYLKRRMAISVHQVFNVIGVLTGLLINKWIALVYILSVTLLWFYSERYKRMPFFGNFIVALLTALSLIVISLHYPQNRDMVMVYAVFSFFISLVREIVKDMEDMKGDKAHGCRTLPIIWGIRRTKTLLFAIIALFVILLFSMSPAFTNELHQVALLSVTLPVLIIVYLIYKADTIRKYAQLSSLCKITMLWGLSTMLLV